jgi:hypothetical protein
MTKSKSAALMTKLSCSGGALFIWGIKNLLANELTEAPKLVRDVAQWINNVFNLL